MICWSQWLCRVRFESGVILLLEPWFRMPPGGWIFVCCECCVLSGRVLCFGLITRPEESYWLRYVRVWLRNLDNKETLAHYGLLSPIYLYIYIYIYIQYRLCGLVVRVSGYRYRGPGFDPRRYKIFWVVVGLERGPLSLVRSNCGATWIKK